MALETMDPHPLVEAARRPPINLPSALRPRAEDDNLVVRAEALVAKMAPYAGIPRLDGRFAHSLGYLAETARGIAALKANEFASEACDVVIAVLADMVASAEAAVAQIQPDLEAERKSRAPKGEGRPSRSRRAAAAA